MKELFIAPTYVYTHCQDAQKELDSIRELQQEEGTCTITFPFARVLDFILK
jgi:hypothetical protein